MMAAATSYILRFENDCVVLRVEQTFEPAFMLAPGLYQYGSVDYSGNLAIVLNEKSRFRIDNVRFNVTMLHENCSRLAISILSSSIFFVPRCNIVRATLFPISTNPSSLARYRAIIGEKRPVRRDCDAIVIQTHGGDLLTVIGPPPSMNELVEFLKK